MEKKQITYSIEKTNDKLNIYGKSKLGRLNDEIRETKRENKRKDACECGVFVKKFHNSPWHDLQKYPESLKFFIPQMIILNLIIWGILLYLRGSENLLDEPIFMIGLIIAIVIIGILMLKPNNENAQSNNGTKNKEKSEKIKKQEVIAVLLFILILYAGFLFGILSITSGLEWIKTAGISIAGLAIIMIIFSILPGIVECRFHALRRELKSKDDEELPHVSNYENQSRGKILFWSYIGLLSICIILYIGLHYAYLETEGGNYNQGYANLSEDTKNHDLSPEVNTTEINESQLNAIDRIKEEDKFFWDSDYKRWVEIFFWSFFGTLVYILWNIQKYARKKNGNFVKFTYWYISKTATGPIIAVVIMFFLMTIEIGGMGFEGAPIGIILGASFILGYYGNLGRAYLEIIKDKYFPGEETKPPVIEIKGLKINRDDAGKKVTVTVKGGVSDDHYGVECVTLQLNEMVKSLDPKEYASFEKDFESKYLKDENEITIRAINEKGKNAIKTITVTYKE